MGGMETRGIINDNQFHLMLNCPRGSKIEKRLLISLRNEF